MRPPEGRVENGDVRDGELDEILEPPLTVREFDQALAGCLSRTQRREFWRALGRADLIVFRA